MAQRYVDIASLREVAQELASAHYLDLQKVDARKLGQVSRKAIYDSNVSRAEGAARMRALLDRSKGTCEASYSFKKYDYDEQLDCIIQVVDQCNTRMAEVGQFLIWVSEIYEECEKKIISRTTDESLTAYVPGQDTAGWDYRPGKVTKGHIGGLVGAAVDLLSGNEPDSPFSDSSINKGSIKFSLYSYEYSEETTYHDGSRDRYENNFVIGGVTGEVMSIFNEPEDVKMDDMYAGFDTSASGVTANFYTEHIERGKEHGYGGGFAISGYSYGATANVESKDSALRYNFGGGYMGRFNVTFQMPIDTSTANAK